MQRAFFAVLVVSVLALSACDRTTAPPPATTPEPTPAPDKVNIPPSPSIDEQKAMAALAAQGAKSLGSLEAQSDVHHGATWLKGTVPANRSTAYLLLGRLGEGGASTLRFVVRYQGARPADLSTCTVAVDDAEVGSFSPAPNRADQPGDGTVVQLADVHFDEVRPLVLAMINGQSAAIRTADGKNIPLNRDDLDEMSRVLSAYLHLQGSAP